MMRAPRIARGDSGRGDEAVRNTLSALACLLVALTPVGCRKSTGIGGAALTDDVTPTTAQANAQVAQMDEN